MEKLGSRKWLKVCTLFIVGVLLLFLGGCGKNNGNSPAFNIAAAWYIYNIEVINGTPGGQESPFTFTTSNTTLNGATSQGMLFTGTTNDTGVNFSGTDTTGVTYTYNGTVGANGTTMQGSLSISPNIQGTWVGIINLGVPTVAIPTSSWALATGGTLGTIDVTFTQSNNSITLTTQQGQQFPLGSIASGGGINNLAFVVNGSDGATYLFVGTVTSSANSLATAMSGTWTSTTGASGTWSAAPKS